MQVDNSAIKVSPTKKVPTRTLDSIISDALGRFEPIYRYRFSRVISVDTGEIEIDLWIERSASTSDVLHYIVSKSGVATFRGTSFNVNYIDSVYTSGVRMERDTPTVITSYTIEHEYREIMVNQEPSWDLH